MLKTVCFNKMLLYFKILTPVHQLPQFFLIWYFEFCV